MIKDPNEVLIPVDGIDWEPKVPVAEAIKNAEEALLNSPQEINININLTGNSASRYNFIKTLMTSLGLPEDETNIFLLQAGVELEIKRLQESLSKTND
jgi:hypothetical protein